MPKLVFIKFPIFSKETHELRKLFAGTHLRGFL